MTFKKSGILSKYKNNLLVAEAFGKKLHCVGVPLKLQIFNSFSVIEAHLNIKVPVQIKNQ